MKARKVITSRWLVVPLATIMGALIGLQIAVRYARTVTDRNWANQAVLFANTAAQIEAGNEAAARGVVRQRMAMALESLAMSVEPVDAGKYSSALRNVSTYLSASSPVKLTPKAQSLLSSFPPLAGPELDSSMCESGICTLAKRVPTVTVP